jgi:hypothetical protein
MLNQFYIPKKIISINIDIEYNNPNIIIIKLFLYNKTYTNFNNISWELCFNKPYTIYSNTVSKRYLYNIFFVIWAYYSYSGCELIKKNDIKTRKFMTIPSIIYNTLYVFFIYNKYYTFYNDYKYYDMLDTIYTYKLFNCRDLYRIVAFI